MQLILPEQITLHSIPSILERASQLRAQEPEAAEMRVDFTPVQHLDMSGLGALVRLTELCDSWGVALHFENVRPEFSSLFQYVNSDAQEGESLPPVSQRGFLEKLGRTVLWYRYDVLNFLEFLGQTQTELFREFFLPHKIRWRDTLYYLEMTGVNALPIVGLISFLLGMIIAFQSAGQLQQFGANIFVVELVSLSMTRELAPLMTAIIVAGRSGSAFTAEIGTMKVSEEVDAMKVMGLDLTEYLIAPKVWALLLSLPLLAFWADVVSIAGGALIAQWKLDINPTHFILRLQETLAVRHVLIGLGKCVVFAAVISIVGCYRGFMVQSGAGSVGRQTTSSVVTSIFFVIITDAGFSVLFTLIGI